MTDRVNEACRKLLREAGLLRERSPELVAFWSRAERLELPPGTVLLREGAPGDALLFVVEGGVQVDVASPGGGPVSVCALSGPILLGITGAVDGALRTATCTTNAPSLVLRMRRGVFADALRQVSPDAETMRELLITTMQRQLLRATGRLQEVLADP